MTEIARNEAQHVGFLRTALGSKAVACPLVNIGSAFSQAANAAVMSTTFNPAYSPYVNDIDFWLASYLLEDVGVSAYKGKPPSWQTINGTLALLLVGLWMSSLCLKLSAPIETAVPLDP